MPPTRTRYVTACQQLLALGVVFAALAPAANIVSLDVVRTTPPGTTPEAAGDGVAARLAAYTKETTRASVVPAQVVDPVVDEVPLTPARGTGSLARRAAPLQSRVVARPTRGVTEITSLPQDVEGFGTVGVTWQHGETIAEKAIAVQVRTSDAGVWSDWQPLDYHDDHGPDPDSAEGRRARPGTDESVVGDVDQVQVKITVDEGQTPDDLTLAVIDPGTPTSTATERPAIDTSTFDAEAQGGALGTTAVDDAEAAAAGSGDALSLARTTYTPKPQIYSRAQWGADEKIRDKSSLHYYEVHGGFVHHTVNANDYTRAEVPAILRSIYAYHVKSRGWSDIGYNFLVDRFGRIWEGRYGGVDRPVVGAHTLNYNDYSFAMSAIGNYDIARPSSAMIQAYGALFAWKLALHGVSASATRAKIGSKYFQAINGHRDAASTACPGRYLYAKIPQIRSLAAAAQKSWSGRELQSDLASTVHPDLVLRRASNKMGVILPTQGLLGVGKAATVSSGWTGSRALASPDLTGDKKPDLLVIPASGPPLVRPGVGDGTFRPGVRTNPRLLDHDLYAAVGDLDGNGKNDLVARDGSSLDVFLRTASATFKKVRVGGSWSGYNLLTGTGDLTGDRKADLVARDTAGKLWIFPGTGNGTFGARRAVAGSWSSYDTITGFGDYNRDGRPDLLLRVKSGGAAYVAPGRGNGTFGTLQGPMSGLAGTYAISSGGSLTGSAEPDLVARRGDDLVRFVNPGTQDLGKPIATGQSFADATTLLNVGDWDRDGFNDVVTRSTAGKLYLYRGNGTGRLASRVFIGSGFSKVSLLAAVGDMTGDGYPDLMGQPASGSLRIYPGDGMHGLKTSYVAYARLSAAKQVGGGRWNSDGAPDSLVRVGNTLKLYPGNGPGGLMGSTTLSVNLSPYDWVIGISNATGSGHSDLLVREKATGNLVLLRGSATGISSKRYLGTGMKSYDLAG